MGSGASQSNKTINRVRWMWKSNDNPWNKSQSVEWIPYSNVENAIIEEAFLSKKSHAMLNTYHIDLKHMIQIDNNDINKQRPVKRSLNHHTQSTLREERFLPNPIAPKTPFSSHYGWVSTFIIEVKKYLQLIEGQLPSRDKTIVPKIVEQAALGIITEGTKQGQKFEAEWMANKLREEKDNGMKKIWKCCAYLYSMNTFLYRKINETMRLVGHQEYEHIWRSQISILGPFCLLLWDDPFNKIPVTHGQFLYRGANLSDDLINSFKECSQSTDRRRSFQAFTSCSRNRKKAEEFGNTLFIMKVNYAYTSYLKPLSEYPDEEEELVQPGVSFTIDRIDFDKSTNKYLIYLTLEHDQHEAYDDLRRNFMVYHADPNTPGRIIDLTGGNNRDDYVNRDGTRTKFGPITPLDYDKDENECTTDTPDHGSLYVSHIN